MELNKKIKNIFSSLKALIFALQKSYRKIFNSEANENFRLSSKLKAAHLSKIFFKNFRQVRGFSLVELIMVIAIFLIITAMTLGNQAKFSSNILITNLAYQLALAIREAQVYGIGSRQAESTFRLGYGIHISAPANLQSKTNTYTFFADRKPDGGTFNYYYDPEDDGDIDIDLITLSQGQRIRNFCGLIMGETSTDVDSWDCWQNPSVAESFELNVVFIKPDPDAHIMGRYGNVSSYTEYSEAEILLESALGDKCRTVRVSGSGQISVDPITSNAETCLSVSSAGGDAITTE